jgi:biopolymer transport protein ExbD
MKLPVRAPRMTTVSVVPFADLALLLILAVSVAGMFSTVRGIGLRFPGTSSPGPRAGESEPVVIVAVSADGLVRVDGAVVRLEDLAGSVRAHLEREPAATVLLAVDPSASYQTAVDVAAPLLAGGVLGSRPLSIPTRRQLEYLQVSGGAAFAGRLP